MLESTEQDILRVLTEFKFGLIDKNDFVLVLNSFYKKKLQYEMRIYVNEGWREKIIFSFFMLAYDRKEFLSKIENEILLNPNGKEVKIYLLVIALMSTNKMKNTIFEKLIYEQNLYSFQKEWIYAAFKICNYKKNSFFTIDNKFDKAFSKYIEAIDIINKVRDINNIERISV